MDKTYKDRIEKIKSKLVSSGEHPSLKDENSDEAFLLAIIDDLTYSPYLGGRKDMFNVGTAVERLLEEGVLFIGSSMKVHVLCNDLFYWGSADGEDVSYKEIQEVWDLWEKDGYDGVSKWCCMKRNQRPQKPIEDDWKKSGFWNDELEALPKV